MQPKERYFCKTHGRWMRNVSDHPLFGRKIDGRTNWVYESRVVMAEYLGRTLDEKEIVHHKDENKTNDKIENLKIVTRKVHQREHHGYHRFFKV